MIPSETEAHIVEELRERWRKGGLEHGRPIDESSPPSGSWAREIEEELLDALTYAARRFKKIRALVREIETLAWMSDAPIARQIKRAINEWKVENEVSEAARDSEVEGAPV